MSEINYISTGVKFVALFVEKDMSLSMTGWYAKINEKLINVEDPNVYNESKQGKACRLVWQTPPSGIMLPSFMCVTLATEYTEIRDLCNTWEKILMQSQVPLPLIFLSCYSFKVLPALSALRLTHACSKSNASTTKPMAFAPSHTLAPTFETISPKTSGTLLLSLPSKANKTFLFSEYFS